MNTHCSPIVPLTVEPNDGATIALLDVADLRNVDDNLIPVSIEDAN